MALQSAADFASEDELRSEINVTPLVDVMLVLLVIFMAERPRAVYATRTAQGGRPAERALARGLR